MKMKIKTEEKKADIALTKSTIIQYAGKLSRKYNNKKVNVDKVKDIIDYSNL